MEFERTPLLVSEVHANCPTCGWAVHTRMFESGMADFGTYIGETTGNLYRVDMDRVKYQGYSLEAMLDPACQAEGGMDKLRPIPEKLHCGACGTTFAADTLTIDREARVLAIALPQDGS